MEMKRNRLLYAGMLVIVMAVGLYSRSGAPCPYIVKEYGGDVLWAGMIYLIACVLFPTKASWKLALGTLLFSYMIECSQLLDYAWLVYLRTTVMRFLLGQGFLWSDMLCYTIGIAGMVFADGVFINWDKKKRGVCASYRLLTKRYFQ